MKNKQEMTEKMLNDDFEQKRKDLLNLKQTMDHNKEILQAKVNKNKYNEAKKKQMLMEQKNLILERGENPNFLIPRQIKMEEHEKAKKYFIVRNF